MFKKIIKNTIISTIIISTIINLIFSIYVFFYTKSNMNSLSNPSLESDDIQNITISISEKLTVSDFSKKIYYSGELSILNINLFILIPSFIIGVLLSLFICIDESRKLKYVLLYLIFNVFINTVITLIYNNILGYTFLDGYKIIFKNTILLYTSAFILIMIIRNLITRHNVNKINSLLKNKKNDIV